VYADRGVELIVTDRVLGVCVRSPLAPPVVLQSTGPGGAKHEVRIGMSNAELRSLMGPSFDVDYLPTFDQRELYRYYRSLGFGVMIKGGKVVEIVIANMARPLQAGL
jgi:hypothetical protein